MMPGINEILVVLAIVMVLARIGKGFGGPKKCRQCGFVLSEIKMREIRGLGYPACPNCGMDLR